MISSVLFGSALLAVASAHGVILNAQGISGSPASVGFQVDPSLARNCTNISPCQQDTTIIRDAEISANIVNECGRTELAGNIDVGENTENALAAGAVTQVAAGTAMTVTIHQVNADGAGPYACDLDQQSNAGVISQNLTVTNNVPGVNGFSQAKTEDFNITVTMPANLACTGGSTGNICTVRCRNNALAGPFGGCFPVQQTDTTASTNSANQISTAQTLAGITARVAHNNKDIKVAVAANQNAGQPSALKEVAAAKELAGLSVTSIAAAVQTPTQANQGTNGNVAAGGKGAAQLTNLAASQATPASTGTAAKAGTGKGAAAKSGAGSAAATNGAKPAKGAAGAKPGANNKRDEYVLRWAKRTNDQSF